MRMEVQRLVTVEQQSSVEYSMLTTPFARNLAEWNEKHFLIICLIETVTM